MVEHESYSLDLIFHALADPTRRGILKMLTSQQYTVSELADPFRMSLAAVSKHIKVLEEAGLLMRARDGRIHRCRMNAEPLRKAQDLIQFYQQFWQDRLRDLDQYLQTSINELTDKGETHGRRKK